VPILVDDWPWMPRAQNNCVLFPWLTLEGGPTCLAPNACSATKLPSCTPSNSTAPVFLPHAACASTAARPPAALFSHHNATPPRLLRSQPSGSTGLPLACSSPTMRRLAFVRASYAKRPGLSRSCLSMSLHYLHSVGEPRGLLCQSTIVSCSTLLSSSSTMYSLLLPWSRPRSAKTCFPTSSTISLLNASLSLAHTTFSGFSAMSLFRNPSQKHDSTFGTNMPLCNISFVPNVFYTDPLLSLSPT
jgi:hypothetical protein